MRVIYMKLYEMEIKYIVFLFYFSDLHIKYIEKEMWINKSDDDGDDDQWLL